MTAALLPETAIGGNAEHLVSYVCRGATSEEDRRRHGECGGGWWGAFMPVVCPDCGRPLYVTGRIRVADLSAS